HLLGIAGKNRLPGLLSPGSGSIIWCVFRQLPIWGLGAATHVNLGLRGISSLRIWRGDGLAGTFALTCRGGNTRRGGRFCQRNGWLLIRAPGSGRPRGRQQHLTVSLIGLDRRTAAIRGTACNTLRPLVGGTIEGVAERV